jgi:hypothetical protein
MPPPPYRGLSPYTDSDDDAELFFGREAEIEIACANLLAARLTLLYGPSGAGKTSLLRAGLVHRLRRSALSDPEATGPRRVVVLIDEWSDEPVAEIVRQARSELGESSAVPEQLGPLADELTALTAHSRVEFLLVLDQFEEYLVGHPAGSRLDVELPSVLEASDVPIRVLIGLREDALAGLDRFKETIPGLFDNYLRLDHLDRAAALEAIEGPIERYNQRADHPVQLEPGLVTDVLDQLSADVSLGHRGTSTDGPEATTARIEPAYLQLVMTRLWDADAPSAHRVRQATLKELGGAKSIVGTHLHATMDGLPEHDQRLASRVFHLLVTPSGVKVRHTASDLAEYLEETEADVERLLRELAQPRKRILRAVTLHDGTSETMAYEIFHDVLANAVLDWRTDHEARERRRLEVRSTRLLTALAAVSALALSLALYMWDPAPLRRLELQTIDTRFGLRGAQGPNPDLLLVAVDDRTLQRRHAGGQLARTDYARLIERVNPDRPRVIACDVIFQRPRGVPPDPAADRRLIRAIRRARDRIVLAFGPASGAAARAAGATQLHSGCQPMWCPSATNPANAPAAHFPAGHEES